jgi:hypothetical protein
VVLGAPQAEANSRRSGPPAAAVADKLALKKEGIVKGWIILVTGPDLGIGENLRRRIVAAAVEDSDEAFAAARTAVPGGMPTSVGPLTEESVADLRLTPGKSRVLGTF